MNKVVHFEIPTDDIKRAQAFYRDVFGWQINEIPEMNYTIVVTGPIDDKRMPKESGFINGGLMERKDEFQYPVVTISVEDIEEAGKKTTEHGGKIIRPKMEIGDMGWAAYFRDSEGNMIGLFQNRSP